MTEAIGPWLSSLPRYYIKSVYNDYKQQSERNIYTKNIHLSLDF